MNAPIAVDMTEGWVCDEYGFEDADGIRVCDCETHGFFCVGCGHVAESADGKVYFVSRSGIASVLSAGPEPVPLSVADLADEVAATPALADGRLYLRSKSALYCFAGAPE